jgi:hypothetical protein
MVDRFREHIDQVRAATPLDTAAIGRLTRGCRKSCKAADRAA